MSGTGAVLLEFCGGQRNSFPDELNFPSDPESTRSDRVAGGADLNPTPTTLGGSCPTVLRPSQGWIVRYMPTVGAWSRSGRPRRCRHPGPRSWWCRRSIPVSNVVVWPHVAGKP